MEGRNRLVEDLDAEGPPNVAGRRSHRRARRSRHHIRRGGDKGGCGKGIAREVKGGDKMRGSAGELVIGPLHDASLNAMPMHLEHL